MASSVIVFWVCGRVVPHARLQHEFPATVELLLEAGARAPEGESLVASDAVRDLLNRRGR